MKHIKPISLFESIDTKSIDLKSDYDKLNKMMFDGVLPDVKLRWMNTKNVLGLMTYDEDGNIKDVGISTFYKLTHQQYLDVLAHEMIHVWIEHKGIKERDPHGRVFMNKVADLNKRFPEFSIRKSENAADYNVSASASIKEYGVVIFDEGDKYSVVVVNSSVMNDDNALTEFIEGIKKYGLYKFRKLTINFYKSANPDLAKFKVKKSLSLKSLELYVIKPELVKDIENDKLVKSVVLKP